MRNIAIVPARSGSKGLSGKNIRLLGGYPLIAYSIAAAIMAKEIERVIVSTDSEEIAAIGRFYGAEAPFLRPSQYAQDKSLDREFITHVMDWLRKNENEIPEYLIHLRPTTPLRNPEVINTAIVELERKLEATSLRSGHLASESPFKWFLRDTEGHFRSFQSGCSLEDPNSPRQLFPEVYVPDGYVDVLKTSFFSHSENLHGDRMVGFISPFCCEVDTLDDFEYLEFELEKKGHLLLDFLRDKYPRKDEYV